MPPKKKKIAKSVVVDTPVEEKWGGSLVPSESNQKKVFVPKDEYDPAESLLDEAEAEASNVAPFETGSAQNIKSNRPSDENDIDTVSGDSSDESELEDQEVALSGEKWLASYVIWRRSSRR